MIRCFVKSQEDFEWQQKRASPPLIVIQAAAWGTVFKVTGGPIETSVPYLQFMGGRQRY